MGERGQGGGGRRREGGAVGRLALAAAGALAELAVRATDVSKAAGPPSERIAVVPLGGVVMERVLGVLVPSVRGEEDDAHSANEVQDENNPHDPRDHLLDRVEEGIG